MLENLKAYMMPIAMLLGVLFQHQAISFAFILPYAIGVMLFITYSSIDFKKIKIKKIHVILIIVQLSFALLGYLILSLFSDILSQSFLVILIMPVASASAIITNMLGGDLESITTYNIINNIIIAIVAPIFFAIPNHNDLGEFLTMSLLIAKRISPIVFGPLILSLFFYLFLPNMQIRIRKYKNISFYIWAFTLIIAVGLTVNSLRSSKLSITILLLIIMLSFLACVFLFTIGRKIGHQLGETIVGGQGLGQKNTLLGIWMALSFFTIPSVALAPGVYIVWQNLINSYQLWKANKKR